MRRTRWQRERSSRLKVKRVRVLITSVIGWLQVTDGKKIIWEDPFSAHSFWKGPNTPLGFSIANIHVPDSPNCSFSTTGEFAAFHSDCILHSASFFLAVFVVSLHAPVSVFWTHRYTEYSQGLPVLCWHTQFRFWYWLSIQNFNIWFHDTSLTTRSWQSIISFCWMRPLGLCAPLESGRERWLPWNPVWCNYNVSVYCEVDPYKCPLSLPCFNLGCCQEEEVWVVPGTAETYIGRSLC